MTEWWWKQVKGGVSKREGKHGRDQDPAGGGTMLWERKNGGLGVTLWLAGMLGRKKKSETKHHKNGMMEFIPVGWKTLKLLRPIEDTEANEWLWEIWLSNPQNHFPGDVALFFQWPRFTGLISNYVRGYGGQEASLGIALNQSSLTGTGALLMWQFGLSQEMSILTLFSQSDKTREVPGLILPKPPIDLS